MCIRDRFTDVEFKGSPGKSFAKMVIDAQPNEVIHEEIFLEQEETRGIVNHSVAYWEHVKDINQPKLFNLSTDPSQLYNQNGHEDYVDAQLSMQRKLHQFFNKYNNPSFDLWNGGTCKGSSARPNTWKAFYGDDWTAVAEKKVAFSED